MQHFFFFLLKGKYVLGKRENCAKAPKNKKKYRKGRLTRNVNPEKQNKQEKEEENTLSKGDKKTKKENTKTADTALQLRELQKNHGRAELLGSENTTLHCSTALRACLHRGSQKKG